MKEPQRLTNNSCTMSCEEEKICRLCLKVSDSDVEVIEEVTREIFNVLLLKLNLSISEDPVMCKNCSEDVQKCFDFKAACMNVEDCIVPLTTAANGSKVDIKEVFLTENGNIGNGDRHICRFCLQSINQGHYKCLDALGRDTVFAEGMLAKYMPEMNLNATKDPMICAPCEESLKNYMLFVKKCWAMERKIVECCKTVGTDSVGQIKLCKVLRYTSTVGRVKTETNLSDSEECRDVEIVDQNLVSIEEEEINIKSEENLMSAEQGDCDSLQGGGSLPTSRPLTYTRLKPRMLVYISPEQVKMYKCELCTYESHRKQSLGRHLVSHQDPSEIKMYKCTLCTHETKWRDNLTTHMKTHMNSSEVKMYKCDKCPYEGNSKNKLTRHMVTHKDPSELNMYKCAMCTYWAKRRGSLRRHIARHKNSSA